jgi:iron complex transport system permease protein
METIAKQKMISLKKRSLLVGKQTRRTLVFLVLLIGLTCSILLNFMFGAATISFQDMIHVLAGDASTTSYNILWNIRIPRTLVAVLVGVNLALAGAILQGVMRNPLADPQIIGVNSGAGLFAVVTLILFPQYQFLLMPLAFMGALIGAAFVYSLAWKNGIRPVRIILAGVAVSAFFGAFISALLVFYSDRVHGAMMFIVGGLSARSWPHFEAILPYTIIGFILALFFTNKMNILLLGDQNARSLGIHVEWTRVILIVLAALLAASAVSVVGLLGFVGLIVPHAARLIVGNDYRILLPASALLGGIVVSLSDLVARNLFAPTEIPVGVMMALIGAPFFLYLLRREIT